MNILDIIENKKNKKELSKEEIQYFVKNYTNILVYIWKQKTECARKTTDFRGHLAKCGRFDKITTKEKCTEKLPEYSEKQEESDA